MGRNLEKLLLASVMRPYIIFYLFSAFTKNTRNYRAYPNNGQIKNSLQSLNIEAKLTFKKSKFKIGVLQILAVLSL